MNRATRASHQVVVKLLLGCSLAAVLGQHLILLHVVREEPFHVLFAILPYAGFLAWMLKDYSANRSGEWARTVAFFLVTGLELAFLATLLFERDADPWLDLAFLFWPAASLWCLLLGLLGAGLASVWARRLKGEKGRMEGEQT